MGDLYRWLHLEEKEKFPHVELFFEDEAVAEFGYSVTTSVSFSFRIL
jgi:hypothetical protein